MNARLYALLAAWTLILSTAATALAQPATPAPIKNPQQAVLSKIGIDQNLNQQLPLELEFRDEQDQQVELGQYFGERPVVLALVYYQCPQLCNQVLNALTTSLKSLDFAPHEDYEVVVVSFDPTEGPELAKSKKAAYMHRLNRDGGDAGFHFLTGAQPEIDALTRAAGFRYEYDEKTKQYAHASAIMIATPDGRLARYFYGIDYPTRDLRLGLIEASAGEIGSPVDAVLLFCYHYDPMTGTYGLAIFRVLQVAGALTVFGLGTFIVVMLRWERQGKLSQQQQQP